MTQKRIKATKVNLLNMLMAIYLFPSYLYAVQPPATHVEFDPTRAPTKAEWQHFNKMSKPQLTALWTFQDQKGFKKIGDWSWQWRIGWIRRCEYLSLPNFCDNIVNAALYDDAMVIRAEAAHRIGMRNENKQNVLAVQELARAFDNPANFRNKHPLFVCDRILESMHKIGGKKAIDTAKKLAAKYPQTNAYWNSLVKIDANRMRKKTSAKN